MVGFIARHKKLTGRKGTAAFLSAALDNRRRSANSPVPKRVEHDIDLNGENLNLYFGDIHGHSDLSPDGYFFSPDHFYKYGKNVSNLDFCALTDHDAPWGLAAHPERWNELVSAAKKHYEPGRFVTFIGYEWTSGDGLVCMKHTLNRGDRWEYQTDPLHFGHRNVYFPSDNVPGHVFSNDDERYNTPEKLWDALEPYGAITIPHHPLGGPVYPFDWSRFNEKIEPVVEIYSAHGNSESDNCEHQIYNPYKNGKHSVKTPLDDGRHFGFIASSDCHQARPGNFTYPFMLIEWCRFFYRGKSNPPGPGLAAIYAKDLSRESIFDAIRQRRTYAVTGARIIVDFRADDNFMGTRFSATASKKISLTAHIESRDAIEKIEIIKNGNSVYTIDNPGTVADIVYDDRARELKSDYMYVRVKRHDQHMAWSSPVRVDVKKHSSVRAKKK